jgi:hypothetical protein
MIRIPCHPHWDRMPAHQPGLIKEAPSPASSSNGLSPLLGVVRCRRACNSQPLPQARRHRAPAKAFANCGSWPARFRALAVAAATQSSEPICPSRGLRFETNEHIRDICRHLIHLPGPYGQAVIAVCSRDLG